MVHLLPWAACIWLLCTTPLLLLSSALLWVQIGPSPEDDRERSAANAEAAPYISSGTGLVALAFGVGVQQAWQLFGPIPPPWRFFPDARTAWFTLVTFCTSCLATLLLDQVLKRRGIARRRMKEFLLALPMAVTRLAASPFGISRTRHWDKMQHPA